MEEKGTMAIPIIGYIIAFLIPIVGLIYGAILVFAKKDTPLYQKHGRFIIYLAIIVFIASFIIRMALGM
jgi:hypothetical protein